ncbi:MAG: acyloxyacyl hydrolase [Thiobacillus sp.]|nr:acyloxyacyl hydrolase [Thiobacillus sp.]MDP2057796.1 acyloxyacyl hydrolase [Thiobacillus sp.]
MAMRNRLGGVGIGGFLGLGLAIALGLHAPAQATELAGNVERTLAIGVLAHDRGPFSDHHEDGVDLNLEVQFAPLDIWGSPRPHLGITANFEGYTSVAYAGLSVRFRETAQWFVDGLLSAAVHDGPLHKDPVRCEQFSDCGYGTRILPRFGLEVGYRVSPAASISLFYDHMSHKWIVGGENEGLDHIGLRFMRPY